MIALGRKNGFPCAVSRSLGKFRGPGKKEDPCPYATLIMLELISLYAELRDTEPARWSVNTLLDLWEHSHTRHPYIFYMGNDFRKLKAPLVWYDILHVADTLSVYPVAHGDPRFHDMLDVIKSKASPDGKYTAESVWKAWGRWDFGQKKEPSSWITFLVWRILRRADG